MRKQLRLITLEEELERERKERKRREEEMVINAMALQNFDKFVFRFK